MERLARERDRAVNQVAEMKRRTAEYSKVLSEKQALETVALQLAEGERDGHGGGQYVEIGCEVHE